MEKSWKSILLLLLALLAIGETGHLGAQPPVSGDRSSQPEKNETETRAQAEKSLPSYADQLRFVERQEETYLLKFSARPDAERFQVTRMPTEKWPQRKNFFLKVGETSEDGQLRLDSFEEKTAERGGIQVDASVLKITYLPKSSKHQLARGVEESIPSRYAVIEHLAEPGQTRRIMEGDTFQLDGHPGLRFRLVKVKEKAAEIACQEEGIDEVTFELKSSHRSRLSALLCAVTVLAAVALGAIVFAPRLWAILQRTLQPPD